MAAKLFQTRTLWAMAMVFALGMIVREIKPLRHIPAAKMSFWDQNPLRTKIERCVNSQPDFLLLGSSLPMTANYEADCNLEHHAAFLGGDYNEHASANYLATQMAKRSGRSLRGVNLSCTACMVADAESILNEAYALGCKPEFVIYCIAPRDFMDNAVGEHMYRSFAVTVPRLLKEASALPFAEALDRLVASTWHLYMLRHDYQYLCQLAAAPFFCFDESAGGKAPGNDRIWLSVRSLADLFVQHDLNGRMTSVQLANHKLDYVSRYRPFSAKAFSKQCRHLKEVCRICRRNGATLYLVNMPIADENRALMPFGFYDKFCSVLAWASTQPHVELIDLQNGEKFASSDFRDTVHLRTGGAVKALAFAAKKIADEELRKSQGIADQGSEITR